MISKQRRIRIKMNKTLCERCQCKKCKENRKHNKFIQELTVKNITNHYMWKTFKELLKEIESLKANKKERDLK